MIAMRDEIEIAAPPQRIFEFASRTERWPEILPHYRYVYVLEESGNERVVQMSALRGPIPVSWTARQINDRENLRVRFTHILGWTRGMEVTWRFETLGDRTNVSIDHELAFAFPVAPDFFGEHVVGNFFVHHIAGKTLRTMKALCEA